MTHAITNEKTTLEKISLGMFGPDIYRITTRITDAETGAELATFVTDVPDKEVSERIARYFQICPSCGKDAFEWRYRPSESTLLHADRIIHAEQPAPGEPIACPHCHVVLTQTDVKTENLRSDV